MNGYDYVREGNIIRIVRAGQAAVEQVALGTTLLLADMPYNRSLFSEFGEFVRSDFDEHTNIATPDRNSFINVMRNITCKDRTQLRTKAQRFSPDLAWERLQLAVEAAYSYFHQTSTKDMYKNLLSTEVDRDLSI